MRRSIVRSALFVAGICLLAAASCEKSSDDAYSEKPETPQSAICGGIAGTPCANPGDFCNIPISGQCGAADQTGICTPRPEVCTADFNPVCGCDGNTYGNACSAAAAGISVASIGECVI